MKFKLPIPWSHKTLAKSIRTKGKYLCIMPIMAIVSGVSLVSGLAPPAAGSSALVPMSMETETPSSGSLLLLTPLLIGAGLCSERSSLKTELKISGLERMDRCTRPSWLRAMGRSTILRGPSFWGASLGLFPADK